MLVSTEPDRLEQLHEDELADLVPVVRRARNKYRDLDVRQSRSAVKEAGRRSVTRTSNQRTLRKAEIFEDALSRVSRYLSRAARASANELRAARIAAAQQEREAAKASTNAGTGKASKPSKGTPTTTSGSSTTPKVSGSRRGSTSQRGKKTQARTDTRSSKR